MGQKHVLTACQDRNARIYSLSTGKHTRSFRASTGDNGSLIKVSLFSFITFIFLVFIFFLILVLSPSKYSLFCVSVFILHILHILRYLLCTDRKSVSYIRKYFKVRKYCSVLFILYFPFYIYLIFQVVLDRSGIYLATSCTDKSLSVYDYYSGECMATMCGHSELATGLRFTNDCHRLISASGDGYVVLFTTSRSFINVLIDVQVHFRVAHTSRYGRDDARSTESTGHATRQDFGR